MPNYNISKNNLISLSFKILLTNYRGLNMTIYMYIYRFFNNNIWYEHIYIRTDLLFQRPCDSMVIIVLKYINTFGMTCLVSVEPIPPPLRSDHKWSANPMYPYPPDPTFFTGHFPVFRYTNNFTYIICVIFVQLFHWTFLGIIFNTKFLLIII